VSSDNGDQPPEPLETNEAAYNESAGPRELPSIDFSTLVLSLSHSALLHLGDAPDPITGKRATNLQLARQTIDLLALLQEKTRGNLTGAEERVIEQALFDLRLRYVEVAKSK
jgi:hypothetical protein